MATQTVEFRAATGLTITAKLFSAGSDTEVASVSATEATNRKGTYRAAYTDVAAGEYQLIAFDSQPIPVASWWVTLEAATATYGTYSKADRLSIADAVWDEAYADHNIAGSFGKLLNTIRKANLAIEGEVTNAITPTTLTFSSNISATTSAYAHAVLLFVDGPLTGENSPIISYNNTNGVFVLEEALTAAPSNGDEFVVIAGSHVHAIADIQSGLATSTGVTAAFTEIKGAGWSSATDTLEKIAESADGGTVTVAPLSSLAPERVNGTTISVAVGDVSPVSIDVYDANGVAIDLTAQGNLEVCIESRDNVDLQVVAHASITISGTGNRKATWTPNAAAVGTVDKQRWSLRTASGKRVLAYGPWVVERVALNDA
jgi:hypothetical protein